MTLFERNHVVGVFRGFSEGGMEFHADIVMPYRDEFQAIPMHGQFVLVQLEHEQEAVFGRITSIAAQGRLTSPVGEDYAVRAVRDQRPIPDELRDQYLKYKVDIRVLGVLREEATKLIFVPSHRRLPHVGTKVAFLTPELLAEVANANDKAEDAAEIGFLAFGEFIYSGGDLRAPTESWMVTLSPTIVPRFQISKLVSRRSFVFARAGFGKSNLVKLLFSKLYATDPAVRRRNGTQVPVGTVIFDPDGEYFWPDHHGRPGLCDVVDLTDRLVVFTNRKAPSQSYASFVVDGVKLDIRQLPAARVIGLPPLDNYAAKLRQRFSSAISAAIQQTSPYGRPNIDIDEADGPAEPVDADATYRSAAIARLRADHGFRHEITSSGIWWWKVARRLGDYGPGDDIIGKGEGFDWGKNVVEQALNEIFGRDGWRKEQREYKGKSLVWVTAASVEAARSETPDGDELPF
jgi:Helicase HerA, central domain